MPPWVSRPILCPPDQLLDRRRGPVDRRSDVKTTPAPNLQSLEAYYAAAERDGTDFSNPPKPPNADVAWEVATLCAKTIATLLDYKKTGKLPENWEPSAGVLA